MGRKKVETVLKVQRSINDNSVLAYNKDKSMMVEANQPALVDQICKMLGLGRGGKVYVIGEVRNNKLVIYRVCERQYDW